MIFRSRGWTGLGTGSETKARWGSQGLTFGFTGLGSGDVGVWSLGSGVGLVGFRLLGSVQGVR